MPPKGFKCKQCGNCCLKLTDTFQGDATATDVARLETERRFDILEWVGVTPLGEGRVQYDRWISPRTGEYVYRCPWLRKVPNKDKYICRIHDVKPEACQAYPKTRKHGLETGCKGFE